MYKKYVAILAITATLLPTLTISADPIPLHEFTEALANGDVEKTATAIRYGATIHGDGTDITLLWTIMHGYPKIAQKLIIDKPELIHIRHPQTGDTPLIAAAIQGYAELAELLIAHGADVHVRTHKGLTAFAYAVVMDNKEIGDKQGDNKKILDNASIVRALILAGADTWVPEHVHQSLTNDMHQTINAAIKEREHAIHASLENASNNKDSLNEESIKQLNSILLHAVARGDLAIVTNILGLNIANIETCDVYDNTLLHLAVANDHTEVANKLLAKKANVNAKTRAGYTPLMIACMNNNLPIALALLRHYETDINIQDANGMTALLYAIGMIRYPVKDFEDPNLSGKDTMLSLLLDSDGRYKHTHKNKISLEQKLQKGVTPLVYAAISNNPQAVTLLVKAGAYTNAINPIDNNTIQSQISPAMCALITKLEQQRAGILAQLKDKILGMLTFI